MKNSLLLCQTLPVYADKVLINDLFGLAWNGHIQYDVVLDSLNQLRTADQWRAGKVLEQKIRQIDFALKDSSLWQSWKVAKSPLLYFISYYYYYYY